MDQGTCRTSEKCGWSGQGLFLKQDKKTPSLMKCLPIYYKIKMFINNQQIENENKLQTHRWVSLILDCSESMKITDLHPTRLLRIFSLLKPFIDNFYEENPLSQLEIIMTSDSSASTISQMSGRKI